ncbi:MAG: DUF2806 domain-containing protein [Betaproteobacteria bacterium]
MPLEIKDLAGLSQPLTKLVDVVSAAIGTAYRPRSIRTQAEAKAHELKTLARAEAEAEVEAHLIKANAIEQRISLLAQTDPNLAQRARQRLLAREIEGQLNVEEIAEQARLALPVTVSPEPVSADWRRKFFQDAEDVCETDMQALWGKVLAGEISKPGSFGLRTLETLKKLSRREAELFRQACSLAMTDGWIALPGNDINTALKPYGFSFEAILTLRDAGLLLHGDGLVKSFPAPLQVENPDKRRVILTNNGVFLELGGVTLSSAQIFSLIFTQAGRELQRLVEASPMEDYLSSLGKAMRQLGLTAKRGSFVPQSDSSSILLFERDL